ncbi:MAG: hypothetical protein V2I26_01935 [Halieaceae bacterium]|jgi:hypothetical protein|nr:hypothetical protein [Halieaceae bacterium]
MTKPESMYWLAAILSLAGLVAHEALGAPMVLPPLLATDLPEDVIWLHHFSWHVGSIAVAAMIIMFVYAALKPGNITMAVIATGMSAGFAALAIGLAIVGSNVMWGTPAPFAWSLIAVIGSVGVGLESRAGTPTHHDEK